LVGFACVFERTIPVSAPVEKIQNYQGSGKTLYVYEAPHDAGILNAIGDLTTTTPGSGLTRPSVEMTFDFTSNGSVPAGSHEIQYATIWDKRSDLIDPVESQTLRANGLTFNDVLPTGKQDGFSDKKVSVIRVPFKSLIRKNMRHASILVRMKIRPLKAT
jgi:von willebrand factor-binding protein, putative